MITDPECQKILKILLRKYQERVSKHTVRVKHQRHPQNAEETAKLLSCDRRTSPDEISRFDEETIHPWGAPTAAVSGPTPTVLFRTWDESSQCRIRTEAEGFLSGASDYDLTTK